MDTVRAPQVLAAAVALALGVAGCSSESDGAADDPAKLNVVTTVSPITSIVANVAGDRAEIRGLVPEEVFAGLRARLAEDFGFSLQPRHFAVTGRCQACGG